MSIPSRDLRPRQEEGFLFITSNIENGVPLMGLSGQPGFGKSIVHQVAATYLVATKQVRLTVTVSPEIVIEHSLLPEKTWTYHFPRTQCPSITVDVREWQQVRDQGKQALYDALRAVRPSYPHLVVSYAALRRWLRDPDFLPQDLSDVMWFFDEGHHISQANGNGLVVKAIQGRQSPLCFITATMFRHTGQILIDTMTAPVFAVSLAEAMSEPDADRYCPKELKMRLEAVPKGQNHLSFMVQLLEKDRHPRLGVFPKAVIKVKSGDSRATADKLRDLLVRKHPGLRVLIVVGEKLDKAVLAAVDRERTVGRYADSQVDVIIACNRFLEGADWPLCSHAYSLDLTNSLVKVLQFAGRGMRSKRRYPDYPEEWRETAFYTQVLSTYIEEEDFRDAHLDRAFILATVVANNSIGMSYLREDLRSLIEISRPPHSGQPNPEAWRNYASALALAEDESKLVLDELARTQTGIMVRQGLSSKQVTPQLMKDALRSQNLPPEKLAQCEQAVDYWAATRSRVIQGYISRVIRKVVGNPENANKNWRWVQASLHECFRKAVEDAKDADGVLFDVITPEEGQPSVLEMVASLTGVDCQKVTQRLVAELPWDRWFARLVLFKEEHGHLDLGLQDETRDLRAWVDRQVEAHRHNVLPPEQRDKLLTLGVTLVRKWSKADLLAELIRQCQDDPRWIPIPGEPLGHFATELRKRGVTDRDRKKLTEAVPWFQWDTDLAIFQRTVQDKGQDILTPGTQSCTWYEDFYRRRHLGGLPAKFDTLPEEFKVLWATLDAAYEKVHREITETRRLNARQAKSLWGIWPDGMVFADRLTDYEREAVFHEPLHHSIQVLLDAIRSPDPRIREGVTRVISSHFLKAGGVFRPGSFLARWWEHLPGEVQREMWSRLGSSAPPMPSRNPDSASQVVPSTPSKDRTDHYTSKAKQEAREHILRVVKECPQLFRDGRLRQSWLELDSVGSRTARMLAPHLNPGYFIGLSREEEVITKNREFVNQRPDLFGPNQDLIVFRHDHLDRALSDLAAYPDLGVLVFDSLNTVANTNLASVLDPMVRFCERRARENGAALLVNNLIVRGNIALGDRGTTDPYHQALRKFGVPEVAPTDVYIYKGGNSQWSMHLHCILFTTTPQNVKGATICEVTP